ncbi:MAG TPA: hypothetical protein VJ849_02315 [Actinomycetes bacterium]|nr:hypothetical protein [Actinomycetes bacterium]
MTQPIDDQAPTFGQPAERTTYDPAILAALVDRHLRSKGVRVQLDGSNAGAILAATRALLIAFGVTPTD